MKIVVGLGSVLLVHVKRIGYRCRFTPVELNTTWLSQTISLMCLHEVQESVAKLWFDERRDIEPKGWLETGFQGHLRLTFLLCSIMKWINLKRYQRIGFGKFYELESMGKRQVMVMVFRAPVLFV